MQGALKDCGAVGVETASNVREGTNTELKCRMSSSNKQHAYVVVS